MNFMGKTRNIPPAYMREIIEKLFGEIDKKNVSFLLGSGISIDSGIPMVGSVNNNYIVDGIETYILVKLGFPPEDISKVLNTIPFEMFFEVLIDNGMNMDAFIHIFESKPSGFHKAIAKLVQTGFTFSIGTTNFDQCIEKSLDELNQDYGVDVCNRRTRKKSKVLIRKFHGSLNHSQDLVISIKRITNKIGFDKRKSVIDDFIEGSDCLIVCGYSCSDIFDLTPVFQTFGDKSRKKIIYISHEQSCKPEVVKNKRDSYYRKVYDMFDGYDLTILRCETQLFINELLRLRGLSPEPKSRYETNWKQTIDNCLNQFDLYQKMKTCGNLYFKINENEKSIDYLNRAHEVSRCISDSIACQRSIAWTLICDEKYEDALQLLLPLSDLGVDIMKENGVHYANIFSNLGVCYTFTDHEKAESYYNLSLDFCREFGLKREEGYALINFAVLYEDEQKLKKAIECVRDALRILKREGYIDGVGICHSNLAKYYLKLQKYKMAMGHIENAIEISSKLGEEKAKTYRLNLMKEIEQRQIANKKYKNNSVQIMEKYKVVLPYDGVEEEKQIKKTVDNYGGIDISWDDTKNIDGNNVCNIVGQIKELINLLGALASIACLCEKRVKIYDGNNKPIKQNIKLKGIVDFFKKLKKEK